MVYRLLAFAAVALSLSLVVSSLLHAQQAEELPEPPPIERVNGDDDDADGDAGNEAEDEEEPQRAELGKTVPDFTLQDQHEEEHTLSDYKGKVIVLEWVNWRCPYVVFHFRLRTQLNLIEKFADMDADTEVVWIGVNSSRWSTPEHNREGAESWEGVEFPTLCDADGTVGRMFNARTTPHMFVICEDFKLRYDGAFDSDSNPRRDSHEGVTNYVEKAVTALLQGEEVETPQTDPYGCRVQYARDGRRGR